MNRIIKFSDIDPITVSVLGENINLLFSPILQAKIENQIYFFTSENYTEVFDFV